MDELMQQFVVEALELTQQAAEDLLALERDARDRSRIDSAFRAIHTLKGSVGLFDLVPMHRALHAAEDILGAAHKGSEDLDARRIEPILEIVEWTERCVRQLATTGALGATEAKQAEELILDLVGNETPTTELAPPPRGAIPPWARALFERDPSPDAVALRYVPLADSFFNGDDPISLMSAVPGIVSVKVSTRDQWADAGMFDPFRSNLIFEAISTAPRGEIEMVFRLLPDQVEVVARPIERATAEPITADQGARTVRVDVARIDKLIDSVGELLTTKNAMTGLIEQARELPGGMALARSIAAMQQDFARLAGELQRGATSVRMVPLSETLRRLPRLVREVSAQVGKTVELSIEGGEIEADKSIVEGLYDPLLHVIRNALDHGIEPASVRQAAGKPSPGSIHIKAWQVGHRVEVQISDDGAGVDLERVRSMAVSRGYIDASDAALLDAADVHELLFGAGFSTAAKVTDVSGRGVGMDAVRAAVERLGGRAMLTSERGRGATVSLSLPTSFAMTTVMMVDAGGDRYGVPMDIIAETTKVPAASIAPIRAGEAFVLRDRTVPVVRLAGLLGLPATRRDPELMLVADTSGGAVGVVIDAVGERFETMLRPPSGLMKAVHGVAGTAVMGNGRVVMVLDLEALIG